MKTFRLLIVLLTVLLGMITGCVKRSGNAKQMQSTNGILKDNLEHGEWTYNYDGKDESHKAGSYIDGLKEGIWKYNINHKEWEVRWKIYEKDNFVINYLNDWQIINNESTDFLALTRDSSKDAYITMIIQDDKFENVEKYLLNVYELMLVDSIEYLIGYTIKRVDFSSGVKAFSGEFYTVLDSIEFVNLIFYVQRDSLILDFTQKLEVDGNVDFSKVIFNDVVYSSFIEDSKLFYIDDAVIKKKLINLDSLLLVNN